ncbi:hypothetical protein pb186bvf_000848 [Paramecium bursaria]
MHMNGRSYISQQSKTPNDKIIIYHQINFTYDLQAAKRPTILQHHFLDCRIQSIQRFNN